MPEGIWIVGDDGLQGMGGGKAEEAVTERSGELFEGVLDREDGEEMRATSLPTPLLGSWIHLRIHLSGFHTGHW